MAIIGFLIVGYILSWFDFHEMFIKAFKELFHLDITEASYYFIFFCIGLIGDIILFFKGTYETIWRKGELFFFAKEFWF